MAQEIMARADVARGLAKYIQERSEDKLYDYGKMCSYNTVEGKIQQGLFNINSEMNTCTACSKQLMAWTANFLIKAADVFEETDQNAAKEITES
jgi:hypothetical protein